MSAPALLKKHQLIDQKLVGKPVIVTVTGSKKTGAGDVAVYAGTLRGFTYDMSLFKSGAQSGQIIRQETVIHLDVTSIRLFHDQHNDPGVFSISAI